MTAKLVSAHSELADVAVKQQKGVLQWNMLCVHSKHVHCYFVHLTGVNIHVLKYIFMICITKWGGQCMYSVTLRHFHATIVAVEKYYIFWPCICSLSYPACNVCTPHCLWLARLYNIFPHYPINGTILKKKVTEHEICILIFSTTFVWNISHSKENWAIYDQNCIGLHINYPFFLSDFNRTWVFATDFCKILKYQILWKSIWW